MARTSRLGNVIRFTTLRRANICICSLHSPYPGFPKAFPKQQWQVNRPSNQRSSRYETGEVRTMTSIKLQPCLFTRACLTSMSNYVYWRRILTIHREFCPSDSSRNSHYSPTCPTFPGSSYAVPANSPLLFISELKRLQDRCGRHYSRLEWSLRSARR
jgi:hypothetical protein